MHLLDTDILSEVLRRRPDPKVIARLRQVEPDEIHASVITLFELRFGSMLRDDARAFWRKIEAEIVPLVRWLDVDRAVASTAGDIAARLQKLGTPIGVGDCLIGATALVHNLVLVFAQRPAFRENHGSAEGNLVRPGGFQPVV